MNDLRLQMEDNSAALTELAKLLPTAAAKNRKPLRCIVTEAVRDSLIHDVPTGLVENDKVSLMLESDYLRASQALDEAMSNQAGAEEALNRRVFLETSPPENDEDRDYLKKVICVYLLKISRFSFDDFKQD